MACVPGWWALGRVALTPFLRSGNSSPGPERKHAWGVAPVRDRGTDPGRKADGSAGSEAQPETAETRERRVTAQRHAGLDEGLDGAELAEVGAGKEVRAHVRF